MLDLDTEMAAASIRLEEPEPGVEDVVQESDERFDDLGARSNIAKSSSSAKQQDTRHIRFGSVHVASYYMTLGSNPGGTSGPPIELGEFHRSDHFASVEIHFQTSHPYRDPDEYKLANRMSRALREELVARDHTEDEICHEIKAAFDIQLSRLRSSKEDILKVWMEEEERIQKEQQARDAELLAGLNRGAGKRRTGKRQKKSVSWLSPSFLGQSPKKTSARDAYSICPGIGSTVKRDGQAIQAEDEKACTSTQGTGVGKRTGPRRVKSKSCPSALFSEKHVKEHDVRHQADQVKEQPANETFAVDMRKGDESSSNGRVQKSMFARLFPFEGRR
eukprot:scaffold12214_cov159-Amphora_coffeaeformis.AAC.1